MNLIKQKLEEKEKTKIEKVQNLIAYYYKLKSGNQSARQFCR